MLNDFDVTRPPVTLPPFLSRDALAFEDVVGLLDKPSEVGFSVESFEAFSLLVSFGFELMLEDLESSVVIVAVISFSVWCVGTTGSSFEGEGFMLTSTSVSVSEVRVGNGAGSSLVCVTVS